MEEPEADPPKGQDLGFLDLNSCEVAHPSYLVDYNGDPWIRMILVQQRQFFLLAWWQMMLT